MNLLRRVVLRLIGVHVERKASYPTPQLKKDSHDYETIYSMLVAEKRGREKAEHQLRVLLDALEFGHDDDNDKGET